MTKLYFLTRDIQNDYPRIGWIPVLPTNATSLWDKFDSWQQQEYPEIILKQKDGIWQLLLTAINSGRKDAGNRIIRVSLFLTGNISENIDNWVLGLIEHYLNEVLNPSSNGELQNIFNEAIKNDELTNLSKASNNEKVAKAETIISLLGHLQLTSDIDTAPKRWRSGCSSANIPRFLGVCKDLITGKRNGFALSLPNLGDCDVPKLISSLPSTDDIAILLSGTGERMLSLKDLTQAVRAPVVGQNRHSTNVGEPTDPLTDMLKTLAKTLLPILVFLILLTCLIRCCGNKEYRLSLTNATCLGQVEKCHAKQEITLQANIPSGIEEEECTFFWESKSCPDIQGKTSRVLSFNMPKCDVDAVVVVTPKVYAINILGGYAMHGEKRVSSISKGITIQVKIEDNSSNFEMWEATGITLSKEQKTNPDISIVMPGNDITLKAKYLK